MPFEIVTELRQPLKLSFDGNQQQEHTGLFKGNFQKSIGSLSKRTAVVIHDLLEAEAARQIANQPSALSDFGVTMHEEWDP